MSNGSKLLNNFGVTPTATVGILSPDKRILLVYSERFAALVPPGGEMEAIDTDILVTAIRKTQEEVGIDLTTIDGNWLNIRGEIIARPEVVQTFPFEMNVVTADGIRLQEFLVHLFLFRLSGEHQEIYQAKRIGEWYSERSLQTGAIRIDGRAYRMLMPGTRETILALLG